MLIRRAFFYWQFAAVVVLPAWLVIGWPIFGSGGWRVLGVFFGAALLGLGMLLVSCLFVARRRVRRERAVSWPDAAALALWHALIVAVGFYAEAAPGLSVLAILVGFGAFSLGLWELYDAARRRVGAVMDEIDQAAKLVYGQPGPGGDPVLGHRDPRSAGGRNRDPKVIVVDEKPRRS